MKVLIIGGVAGGATCAARLRRLDERAEIVLLERGEYISFANCGLPYYVGGVIEDRGELTLQTPESFNARFNVDVRVNNEALSVDPAQKTVLVKRTRTGETYTESYDKLVLAPGAKPIMPDLPGIERDRFFTLHTVPDALRMRDFVVEKKPKHATVVGGGAIGLETAENLVEAGVAVTVVQRSDHVIAAIDGDMAALAHNHMRAKGIKLMLNSDIRGFAPSGNRIGVELAQTSFETDMVILSVGVTPENNLARNAGLTLGKKGSIVVDEYMLTSDPDIYAVGDAVEVQDLVTGERVNVPLAGPANKQGRIVADNLCGARRSYRGTQGSFIIQVFDLTVASTGINERTARQMGIQYDKVFVHSASHAGYYPGGSNMVIKAIFALPDGKLLGAQIVGKDGVDKRCDVLATAIRAGMTADDLTELELCYAPPYSSAKDPVNMVGFVIENLLTGKVKQFHWHEVKDIPRDGSCNLIDTRAPETYARGHIEGFKNIPVYEIRDRMGELDPKKPTYINCETAVTSYISLRVLTQNGFDCRHLSGAWRFYSQVMRDLRDRENG